MSGIHYNTEPPPPPPPPPSQRKSNAAQIQPCTIYALAFLTGGSP